MKKILYITTIGTTVNAFLIPHIKFLIDRGYKVDVATNIDVEISDEILKAGTRVFNVPFQRNPFSFKNKDAFKLIKEIQQRECYDIVHVHTPVASFVSRLALRHEKNLKIIYTCHGFHFYKGGPIANWIIFYPIEKIAAKWTDCILTINSEDFNLAKKFKLRSSGSVNKINGVGIEKEKYFIKDFDTNKYREKLGFDEEDFIILVLAELNKNKNHMQLIEAINILKEKYPKIKVLLAGKGPLEENIKNKISEYNLEEKIKLLGWRNDINELINLSDLIGLFSKREGLGKCILEGMVCGKPVIATNTRGPRELIKDNWNGFLVEFGNSSQTAEAISKIYENKELKCMFGQNCLNKSKDYLLKNILLELDSEYKKLYIK
jgi:glycosyltransferase involved in cell wall biosynthesis